MFDGTSILSSEQDWCRANIPCSDVSSMLYALIVHDAVHSSRSYQEPYGFCPWDRDCVLNDLEALGGTRLLLRNQYNTGIFSCFLLLLPAMLFFHLSSDQWWQCRKYFWRSSLILQKSIAPSSSLCSLPWRRRWINFFDTAKSETEYSPGSTSVQILSPTGIVLVKEPADSRLCGFASAFDRHAKSLAFNFNAYSSNCTSEVSCSLLFKFVTNLFKPWEILTQEWELSLFMYIILISTPYLPCMQQVATSNTGPILELRRSDPLNQVRVFHPTSILWTRKWFRILLNCVKLKFVSYTSNWLEQTYDFQKCTMFHLM